MLNLCYIFKLTAILLPIRWGFLFLKCLRVFTSGKPIFILILLSKFYLYAYQRQGLRSGLALIYIGAISGLFYWSLIKPTRRLGLCGALLARRFLPNMSELLSFFFLSIIFGVKFQHSRGFLVIYAKRWPQLKVISAPFRCYITSSQCLSYSLPPLLKSLPDTHTTRDHSLYHCAARQS